MSPVRGVIFDVGGTLGTVNREQDEIVADGARALDAFLRTEGMDQLPERFPQLWIEACRFTAQKSAQEKKRIGQTIH